MTTTRLLASGLISALLGLAACAADTRAPDPRDPGDPSSHPSPAMHGAILTTSAPRVDLPLAGLPSPIPAPPATLTLTLAVAAIDNPGGQAFSLAASLIGTGAAGAAALDEPIGSVTPYPASNPGSFVLGVPEAARKALSRGDGQLVLRLALQPIAADRPLADPLRVTLGDPIWR